jgi:linoleoyl-CoA desaturase
VREICERYELPYNTGPFLKQLAAVQRTILRLAFPGGRPRPKPGPYRGAAEEGAEEPVAMAPAA